MENFIPIIFLSTPLCALLLFIFFRAKYKWDKSQKIRSSLNQNDFKEFKNLKIRSDSNKGGKALWGFTIDGVVFINDNNIVLLPAKWSLILFHTELPSWIDRNNKKKPYKVKFNKLNSISIKYHTNTLHLGKAIVEYVLKTKSAKQKKRNDGIYEKLVLIAEL